MTKDEKKNIHAIQVLTTMQGEGPDIGKWMVLIRFKKCNRVEEKKACPFCDTLVTMRNTTETEIDTIGIQNILSLNNYGLMITGGEPGYKNNFEESVFLLNSLNYSLANVETNGYNLENFLKEVKVNNVKFIYSPKIFDRSELKENLLKSEQVLKDLRVYIKVVYENNKLIKEYLDELKEISDPKDITRIYLMPEGSTREKLIEHSEEVFDICEKYGFNFSSRSHIIYGFI